MGWRKAVTSATVRMPASCVCAPAKHVPRPSDRNVTEEQRARATSATPRSDRELYIRYRHRVAGYMSRKRRFWRMDLMRETIGIFDSRNIWPDVDISLISKACNFSPKSLRACLPLIRADAITELSVPGLVLHLELNTGVALEHQD